MLKLDAPINGLFPVSTYSSAGLKLKLCGYADTAFGICQLPAVSASQFAHWSNFHHPAGLKELRSPGTPEL